MYDNNTKNEKRKWKCIIMKSVQYTGSCVILSKHRLRYHKWVLFSTDISKCLRTIFAGDISGFNAFAYAVLSAWPGLAYPSSCSLCPSLCVKFLLSLQSPALRCRLQVLSPALQVVCCCIHSSWDHIAQVYICFSFYTRAPWGQEPSIIYCSFPCVCHKSTC